MGGHQMKKNIKIALIFVALCGAFFGLIKLNEILGQEDNNYDVDSLPPNFEDAKRKIISEWQKQTMWSEELYIKHKNSIEFKGTNDINIGESGAEALMTTLTEEAINSVCNAYFNELRNLPKYNGKSNIYKDSKLQHNYNGLEYILKDREINFNNRRNTDTVYRTNILFNNILKFSWNVSPNFANNMWTSFERRKQSKITEAINYTREDMYFKISHIFNSYLDSDGRLGTTDKNNYYNGYQIKDKEIKGIIQQITDKFTPIPETVTDLENGIRQLQSIVTQLSKETDASEIRALKTEYDNKLDSIQNANNNPQTYNE